LFMQQAIKGIIEDFHYEKALGVWAMVNGLWGLFIAFGFTLSSLLVRTSRKWLLLRGWLRALLTDYGVPALVIVWSGISYAVGGDMISRVQTPNTWDVNSTWTVTEEMTRVPGTYIAGALIPAAIIALLFYFDHNVSSQLAQQEDFNLKKPSSAYHWDMLLLGFMTILCGLIGLPPVNGVIPQSPMHTKALAKVVNLPKSTEVKGNDNSDDKSKPDDWVIKLQVTEQRGSNLMQSLLVGACLAIIVVIRCIPTAVLWGYFAFMAIEGISGSQLWDRILLLLTDPKRRYRILESNHSSYLEKVPMRKIQFFTLFQLSIVGAIYALTWIPIGGVFFPIPIILLIPIRKYVMPKMFGLVALQELDKIEEETTTALPHELAVREAEVQGLGPAKEDVSPEESDVLDAEISHYRVVHHLPHDLNVSQRQTSAQEESEENV